VPRGDKNHTWDEDDDLVALYLYRAPHQDHPKMKPEQIAKLLGMSEASLIMRRGNFAHLDGKGGLSHPAAQSIQIYERHKNTPLGELRGMALRVLEAKRAKQP
jgi:hypothetical protein